jgi:hypothetical protein
MTDAKERLAAQHAKEEARATLTASARCHAFQSRALNK